MAAVPAAERQPRGLDAYWLGVWRHALKVLKEQGTWCWEQRPLLDEYVMALRESKAAREEAERDPYRVTDQGLVHPHPGFLVSDRSARRAMALANQLILTPEARRNHGLEDDEEPEPEGDLAGL